MRITIVTGPFFPIPPAPCGAVERLWWDLAREFVRRGHAVRLLCRPDESGRAEEMRDGVSVRRLSAWTSTGSLAVNLAKDLVYAVHAVACLRPADILVTNTFWLPVLARLRPRAGCVVVNVGRMPKGQMRLYNALRVSCLAAVSRALGEAIQRECPAAAARTVVVPNPIDTLHFSPPDVARSWQAPFQLTYAGRIHPEKGVHVLLQAAHLLHRSGLRFRLTIAGAWRTSDGGGGEAYRRRLCALAEGLPVTFLDPLYDRAAFADLLRTTHLFCYPSLAEKGESFGVAPLEAMATGAVPVVSDLACFRDFIRPGANAFVFDHRSRRRAQALARVIRDAVNDPDALAGMSACGARDARAFSVPAVAGNYLELFDHLRVKGSVPRNR
ncbi:MAG: hypothetical protein PWP23_1073 [Candidatus Sumerlaeota bacterium]|nr:hypothetical protein [Candidatus Sumerlaeota bacterium]